MAASRFGRSFAFVVLSLAWPGSAFTQAPADKPLPLGATEKGSSTSDQPARYRLSTKSAGILTVAIRGLDDTDLVLSVTDEDGQELPEGRSDRDLDGSGGAEQLAVTLPAAGSYFVQVSGRGTGTSNFSLGSAWLPFAELARKPDPDGRPTAARAIPIGKSLDETLQPSAGDRWDWFVVKGNASGTLTAVTRAAEGDIKLEAFAPGKFGQPVAQSDQDLQGSRGSESVTVPIEAGQAVYVRVSVSPYEQKTIPYRLSLGLVPQ